MGWLNQQASEASLEAQMVNNPPAMQETWVRSLVGKTPGEGKGYLLQYSGQENFIDCTVHRVTKSRTRLSDFHFISASCPSTPKWVREYFQKTMTLSYVSTTQHPNQEISIAVTLTANPETLFRFHRLSQQHLFPFWSKIQFRITVLFSCHMSLVSFPLDQLSVDVSSPLPPTVSRERARKGDRSMAILLLTVI